MAVAPYAGDGRRQLLYYDTGVGTRWYDRIRGGISGLKISRISLEAYRPLMERHEDGDGTFLFDTSRGAYMVRRRAFEPCVWRKQDGTYGQRLELVWFAGAHSNIGGGYRDTGLSDIALDLDDGSCRGMRAGIRPRPLGRLGLDIRPDWSGRLVDSRTGLYRLVPEYVRPIEPAHDNTAVAPEAWQRFDADPAYRAACPNLAGLGREGRP